MGFHVDTTGNVWLGSGSTGTTLANAITAGPPNFYVTTLGSVYAASGTIGGIDLASTHIQSSNYSSTAGFKIESDGDAFFNSVDIRIDSSGESDDDVPGDGKQVLTVGTANIYEHNNHLVLNATSTGNKIIVKSGDKFVLSGISANPNLTFDGALNGDLEFNLAAIDDGTTSHGRSYSTESLGVVNELTISNPAVDIFRVNAQNSDVYFYGQVQIAGDFIPNNLKAYNGFGSSGQTLQRTSNGIEWVNSSGSHADGDHTSFAASGHNHDSSYDDYEKWVLKGNGNSLNVLPGYGVEFIGGSGIDLSVNTSPYEITFSHGAGTHVSNSTAVQALFPGGVRGSVTLGSGTTGRFFNGIGQSGQNYTWNTTGSFNGTPTFSGTIYVGTSIFHPTSNDGGGFIGFSDNRFNRLYASNGVSTTSDERLKENIENIPFGLDYLKTLRPVQFEWIPRYKDECTICGCVVEDGNDSCENCWEDVKDEEGLIIDKLYCQCETTSVDITGNKKLWGFIAQELIDTPPEPDIDIELIDHNSETDSYNMNYSQLIAPLVKAVQELSTQILDLTARVEALEG
tara:strand:+ start:7436 stop:9142 length:1707 start_codon:yes stop_codon:yes gene_type:complete